MMVHVARSMHGGSLNRILLIAGGHRYSRDIRSWYLVLLFDDIFDGNNSWVGTRKESHSDGDTDDINFLKASQYVLARR